MRAVDLMRISARNLFISPLRSALTVLGLSVGIGAIIAVMSLGSSGQAELNLQLQSFGINRVWVTAQNEEGRGLTSADADYLGRAMSQAAVSPSRTEARMAVASGVSAKVELVGCTGSILEVEQIPMAQGRFFGEQDELYAARVVVLDGELAARLFPEGSPLGKRVGFDGQSFTVIGLADVKNSQFVTAFVTEGRCYIPLSAAQRAFGGTEIDEISVRAPYSMTQTRNLIEQAFARRMGRTDAVQITTMEAEIATARRIMDIFVLVLAGVAGICMLTGGIGVMNILLVSVRERRREIGISKAIGAKSSHIRIQFLLEGLCYAAGGVCLGIALGAAMSFLCGRIVGIPVSIQPSALAVAAALTCAVTLICSLLPASRAAKLRPVEALMP